VINLHSFKNLFRYTIFLCACCTGFVYAEETSVPDNAGSNLTENSSSEESSTPIPQPPVIDPQPQPVYEPADTHTTADEANPSPANQTSEPIAQPPAIDQPVEPAYEPKSPEPANSEITDAPTSAPEIEADTVNDQLQSNHWMDTRPEKIKADWLQLKSGEWLRGRIIIMQKDKLEFDSDELNVLEIDWKKVRYIKSYEPYRLRFDGRVIKAGNIEITENEVHLTTDYDDEILPRSQLQTIASGKETELSYWSSKITFSINVRRGNTNQTDFASKINAKRRTTESRLVLDYLGNFTEVESAETINNHRLNGTLDYFITRHLFWTLVSAEFFRDPFQNIEYRRNISTGLGYSLIHSNKSEWDISLAPGYQQTRFVSVQEDDPKDNNAFMLIFSTKFETELNDKVDLEGTYSATLGDNNTGNYTHHSILTVETELTDKLDLDVSFVWDRVRSPVADENNITPEKDDLRILVGLGYDL